MVEGDDQATFSAFIGASTRMRASGPGQGAVKHGSYYLLCYTAPGVLAPGPHLSAATYPYLEQLATLGVAGALRNSESLRKATVAHDGRLFGEDLARIQAIATTPHDELLNIP